VTYNKSLKENDDLKLQLVKLVREDGCSIAEAARILQLSERTCQSFFKQDMQWAVDWWKEFDKTKKQFVGWMKPAFFEKLQAEVEFGTPATEDEMLMVADYKERISPIKIIHERWKQENNPTPLKIVIVADTQCKPTEDLTYMSWIGQYIAAKRPDVIVHIGDHYDFPSLSSYDKGKKSFEGRRLQADIDAGNRGLELLMQEFPKDYSPRLVFCMGNHEERLDRLANDMPELSGYVGTDKLPLEEMGWEVHPFLKPVEIGGIFFVHYLANPFTGKPYSGTAMNQLKTVGRSFVVGHKQCLDVAIRPTIDGKHQIGIINGAAYPFDEVYKGHQGNSHFRGITMLHEVKDGFGTPMFVSLDYLKNRYVDQ
jgi:hypothetical protein